MPYEQGSQGGYQMYVLPQQSGVIPTFNRDSVQFSPTDQVGATTHSQVAQSLAQMNHNLQIEVASSQAMERDLAATASNGHPVTSGWEEMEPIQQNAPIYQTSEIQEKFQENLRKTAGSASPPNPENSEIQKNIEQDYQITEVMIKSET